MEEKELHEKYNSILLSESDDDGIKTGLGFIDIRLKSKNKLNYHFINIKDNLCFFALQTTIEL